MKKYSKKDYLKELFTLSLPVIGEMSLNTLLGIADTIMISYFLGKAALSASGFTNQIVFTLIFIFTAFNVGATALIARNYGEKNYKMLNKVASQSFFLNLILGIILTIVAFTFKTQLFSIFDLSVIARKFQVDYFKYIAFGILPLFLNMNMTAILRGSGDTKTPLKITFISNLLNIAGNYVLITGFGPFPELGITGAAISTTISRVFAFICYSKYLLNYNNKPHINFKNMFFTKQVFKPLIKISLPSALEQTLMQLSFLTVGVIISKLDTTNEAGFRVIMNIESLSFMPAIGLSIAAATLTGKALGEKDKSKAYMFGKLTALCGVIWGISVGLLFIFIPKPLLYAFTNDPLVIEIGISTLFIAGLNQPFLNYIISTSGAIRGAGETFSIMLLTIFRLWIINVPLTYYFIIVKSMNLKGVWLSELFSFTIASFILLILFSKKKWLNKEITL